MEEDKYSCSGPVIIIIMEDELTVSTMDAGSIVMARPERVAVDVTTEDAGAKAPAIGATAAARKRKRADLMVGERNEKMREKTKRWGKMGGSTCSIQRYPRPQLKPN